MSDPNAGEGITVIPRGDALELLGHEAREGANLGAPARAACVIKLIWKGRPWSSGDFDSTRASAPCASCSSSTAIPSKGLVARSSSTSRARGLPSCFDSRLAARDGRRPARSGRCTSRCPVAVIHRRTGARVGRSFDMMDLSKAHVSERRGGGSGLAPHRRSRATSSHQSAGTKVSGSWSDPDNLVMISG
jgi:hypothetical protein